MADVTLTYQGVALDVSSGDLLIPVAGAWTAHLILADTELVPSGLVTLTWLGTPLTGFVLQSGISEGRVSCLVTGGRGGLWRVLPPKMYDYSLAVRLPLTEILAAAGESLSPESSPAILSRTLPNWVRIEGECGAQLDALAAQVGASWSVSSDGSIWFGVETWPSVDGEYREDSEYKLLSEDPVADLLTLEPFELVAWPGDRFRTRKVGTVHYSISPDEARVRVWMLREDAATGEDPLRVGLEALIRETMRFVDYHALYPGRVVTQRANGTLDVILDSPRIPPLTSVPVRTFLPGAKLTIPAGSRVQISFAQGDPTSYQTSLFEAGSANRPVARVQDQVDLGVLTLTVSGGAAAPAVLAGSYTDGLGKTTVVASGTPLPLKGKIITGSDLVSLP